MRTFKEYVNESNNIFLGTLGEATETVEIKSLPLKKIENILSDLKKSNEEEYFFDDLYDLTDMSLAPNDEKDTIKMIDAMIAKKLFVRWDLDGSGVVGVGPDRKKLKAALIKEFGN